MGIEDKLFEEPGNVCEMPLRRARVGHRLRGAVLGGQRRRERLVAFARRRLMQQLEQRGASHAEIERARGVLP